MAKDIQQSIELPASPDVLFEMYVDAKQHSAFTWRSTNFGADDPDSILVLAFSEAPSGGRIDLVHTGVADRDYEGVTKGWRKYYWDPWRAFLEAG